MATLSADIDLLGGLLRQVPDTALIGADAAGSAASFRL